VLHLHRVTDECEAYTARKQAVKIGSENSACRDADPVNKSEGSIRRTATARLSDVDGSGIGL